MIIALWLILLHLVIIVGWLGVYFFSQDGKLGPALASVVLIVLAFVFLVGIIGSEIDQRRK